MTERESTSLGVESTFAVASFIWITWRALVLLWSTYRFHSENASVAVRRWTKGGSVWKAKLMARHLILIQLKDGLQHYHSSAKHFMSPRVSQITDHSLW